MHWGPTHHAWMDAWMNQNIYQIPEQTRAVKLAVNNVLKWPINSAWSDRNSGKEKNNRLAVVVVTSIKSYLQMGFNGKDRKADGGSWIEQPNRALLVERQNRNFHAIPLTRWCKSTLEFSLQIQQTKPTGQYSNQCIVVYESFSSCRTSYTIILKNDESCDNLPFRCEYIA